MGITVAKKISHTLKYQSLKVIQGQSLVIDMETRKDFTRIIVVQGIVIDWIRTRLLSSGLIVQLRGRMITEE